jgi:hypothetical protein
MIRDIKTWMPWWLGHDSEGFSKLYLFSSNIPSSIALISVNERCHIITAIVSHNRVNTADV